MERHSDPGFAAAMEPDGDEVVVVVRGEVDLASAPSFSTVVHEAMRAQPRLVLDLSETTFLDSTGIAVLVSAHHALGRDRSAIVVRDASPVVRKVLRISGLDTLLVMDAASAC
jgi:anti-anti-sigma factor